MKFLQVEVLYGPLPLPAEQIPPLNFARNSLQELYFEPQVSQAKLDANIAQAAEIFRKWHEGFREFHKRTVNFRHVFQPLPSR